MGRRNNMVSSVLFGVLCIFLARCSERPVAGGIVARNRVGGMILATLLNPKLEVFE
jgi:hypothetical protein